MTIREDMSNGADEEIRSLVEKNYIGSVAQLVEQWTENPCVGGSIPSRATFIWRGSEVAKRGGL